MKAARYTEQMPFVGNTTQFALMNETNKSGTVDSKAEVIRTGLRLLFGLNEDEELPEGVSIEQAVAQAQKIIARPENFKVVRKEPQDFPDYVETAQAAPVA